MQERFDGDFTRQHALPEAAVEAALGVLRDGRLHRYTQTAPEVSEVSALEAEFAAWLGARYCLAVTSGGYAMATALRALGVGPGDRVLSNAFTLAPVPGAIASVGAEPVLVEVTRALTIDLGHLAERIAASGARVLLLSHMRGHVCDMDALMALCDGAGVTVVEDCAHTMGARWRGVPSGRHGRIACFSTQTYKHMNSGEGGFVTTDDAELAARMVLLSGSYMLYDRHGAAPGPEVFAGLRLEVPNVSGRMDALRAAILRPQLARLDADCRAWTALYRVVEDGLRGTPGVSIVERPEEEAFVGSSFQFLLEDWPADAVQAVVAGCAGRGVVLKWFGAPEPAGYTSAYRHWAYARPAPLPRTDRVLAGLLDMRLPLTFTEADCALIARIVRSEVQAARPGRAAAE